MDCIPREIQIEIILYLAVKEKYFSFIRHRDTVKGLLTYRLVNKLFRDYNPINKFLYSTIYRNECLKEIIEGNKENINWVEVLQGHPRITYPYLSELNISNIWREIRASDDYCHYNSSFYPFFGKDIQLDDKDKFRLMDSSSLHSYLHTTYGRDWIEKINKDHFMDAIKYRRLYNTYEDTEQFYTLFLDQMCSMFDNILSILGVIMITCKTVKLLINHQIYKTIFSLDTIHDGKEQWCLSMILGNLSEDRIREDFIDSGFIERHNLWYILYNEVSEDIVKEYVDKIRMANGKIFSVKYSLDFIDENYDIIDWNRLFGGSRSTVDIFLCENAKKIGKKDTKIKLGDIIYKHIRYIMNVNMLDRYWLRYINADRLREDKELWKELIKWNGYKIICEKTKNGQILDESTGRLNIVYKKELEEWIVKNINRIDLNNMMSEFLYTSEDFIRRLLKLFPERFTKKIWNNLIRKENLSVSFLKEHKDKFVTYYTKFYTSHPPFL
ncbi:Hypothetical protein ORPV_1166 [Orpheovirus IHUMI-LCC2]|uniref:Uncharacterized protein n=1 Tax=Orpheovirus IHUMI-LCC2 TaxID=2023057 RepID=A0A2I2L6E9_9VIRU|nr:Hypothetical protein ORPV_1166 [Orpheovirus IHUMI-LCC2]SNW63070.1 Hypothetical protein ORPV_1166 [Orpheovirus IHUMI-LCC2]